jgi:ethanolamine ammonia-lyase small subunit
MKEEAEYIDPVNPLKAFTAARIGMGLSGVSIPLKYELEFKLAHAHARDAVYSTLDTERLLQSLHNFRLPALHLHTLADNRYHYLKRPDKGRKLNEASIAQLQDFPSSDIVIIIADGLSATAVNENSFGLLELLIPKLLTMKVKIAPFCLVEQGRVAIGDDIAHGLNAKLSVVLIGERPGLSAADSLGVYITYSPRPGLTDEARNCVSNIRPGGLNYAPAADKIFYLVQEAFKRKLSGVNLKDNAGLLGG